jgi:DNA-binding protein WhiA
LCIIRGGVKLSKIDNDLDENYAQGDATLAGAEFTIYNKSKESIMVDGKEIAVDGEALAEGVVACARAFGVHARLNRRRNSFAVYLKSFDDIHALLRAMGAERSAELCRRVRQMKSVKNDVNRTVNAEMANQRRASHAGADQLELVRDALSLIGRDALPQSLLAFCEARIANPDLSLRDLGATMDPPASKSALYHRLLRLEKLVAAARERACAATTSS